MAQYRLNFSFTNGSGQVIVNSVPMTTTYGLAGSFEEGSSVTIETNLLSGFSGLTYSIFPNGTSSTSNPWTFTMPANDIVVSIFADGVWQPADDYGLKYYSEFRNQTNQCIRFEILGDGYSGASELVKLSDSFTYRFGQFGIDDFETIFSSSINFGMVGARDKFFELLDGGYRKWMVRVKIDNVLFWEGYLSNSILSVNEVGYDQIQSFTAVDGLKSLDAIRCEQSLWPIATDQKAIYGIVGALNQTFKLFRVINASCEIYETRMDRNVGLFEQFLIPAASVFTDGEDPRYIDENGNVLNRSVYISEFLRNILRPFLCRVFLWKNEFYIVSTPEFAKGSYRLFKYDEVGEFIEVDTVNAGLNISCTFTNGQRTGKPVSTEFTVNLKTGVLDIEGRGGVLEVAFDTENFFVNGLSSPYAGAYQLRNWLYVRTLPANRTTGYPSGTQTAILQFVSNAFGTYAKFWGCSSSSGLSDPAISYIETNTFQNGEAIIIAQDTANKLSFELEFLFEGVSSTEPIRPNYFCGVMIRIGNSWMTYDGATTFGWQGTENVMLFPLTNKNSWNTIDIVDVNVPEDGQVFIRLYEVITTNATVDRYTVGYRNLKLTIQENEALVLSDISDKKVTDETYSVVYPEYEIKIGDVPTDNSTSAIKLNQTGFPFSANWSRDGVESLPLSQIILHELSNVAGTQNPRLILTVAREDFDTLPFNPVEVVPLQNVVYDGHYWMVQAIELDFVRNLWRIELLRLTQIPT